MITINIDLMTLQMIVLYKDPDGKSVKVTSSPVQLPSSSKNISVENNTNNDGKVVLLETRLKEKDNKITELTLEIEKLKVSPGTRIILYSLIAITEMDLKEVHGITRNEWTLPQYYFPIFRVIRSSFHYGVSMAEKNLRHCYQF